MKTICRAWFFAVALCTALLAQGQSDWHVQFPGFKIAGNLYYVGTADLAIYLIHTPAGNILINANYPQDLPSLRKSIDELGFKYAGTKILLISHAHGDHDAALGMIQKQTGAKVMIMGPDVAEVESTAPGRPGAKVDRILKDGDIVELGGARLKAVLTAGHTPGCTTWTMEVEEGGRRLHAVIVGSPNVNAGYILVGNQKYPAIADDYVKSFKTWNELPVDLFLGAHGGYFNMKAKHAKMKPGAPNPFIDKPGYQAYIADRQAAFEKEWAKQKGGGAR